MCNIYKLEEFTILEVIIISRLDHYFTYKKLFKEGFISKNHKLIIIQSEHKTENKIQEKDKNKILDIMGNPILPFCRNPFNLFKRLRTINSQLRKTKRKILELKPKKILGIADSFYSIALLSSFESIGFDIALIENGLSTYEHESEYGTSGKLTLRIIFANLILSFSKELRQVKAVDYVYEILFKIKKTQKKQITLYTNFKLICKDSFNQILIKDIPKSNFHIERISESHEIFFFSQPFYLLDICSIEEYISFLKNTLKVFKNRIIKIIPHPSENKVFINCIKKNLPKNYKIISNNTNASNEEIYLNRKNAIFISINTSTFLHANLHFSSGIIFLNKIFINDCKNAEYFFSFFNKFCEQNNFLNPTKKQLLNMIKF